MKLGRASIHWRRRFTVVEVAHAQDALRDVLWDVMKLLTVAQKAGQVGVQIGRTKAAKLSSKGANDLIASSRYVLPCPSHPLKTALPVRCRLARFLYR